MSPLSFATLLSPQLPTIIDLLMADEVSLADLDWCAAMTKHVGHFQVCAVSQCCAVLVCALSHCSAVLVCAVSQCCAVLLLLLSQCSAVAAVVVFVVVVVGTSSCRAVFQLHVFRSVAWHWGMFICYPPTTTHTCAVDVLQQESQQQFSRNSGPPLS